MRELKKLHNQLMKANEKKVDVIAPMSTTEFVAKDDRNYLILPKGETLPSEYHDFRFSDIGNRVLELSPHAMQQLCSKIGVPMSYMNKCEPEAREYNLSHWMKKLESNSMFRCILEEDSPRVRGIMSERYTPVDDSFVIDCLNSAVLNGNIENPIMTRSYTGEDMMRVQVTDGKKAVVGDTMLSCYVKNSEVGCSSLTICMGLYTYSCTNGAIITNSEFSFNRRHIGNISQSMITDNFQNQILSIMGNYTHMMKYMEIAGQINVSKNKFKKYLERSKDFSLDFKDGMKSRIRQLPTKNVLWTYVSHMTEQSQQFPEQTRMEIEKQAGQYMDQVIKKEVKKGKYELIAA